MSDLYQGLKTEFEDLDYRYGYAESFLNTKIATQIKTLREQRGKTQAEVAALMGIKQPGYQRFEDVNHSVWKTDSLWSIARANGVRLNISFETFGSLLDDKKYFTKESLDRPPFEDDPAFKDQPDEEPKKASAARGNNSIQRAAGYQLGDVLDGNEWTLGGSSEYLGAPSSGTMTLREQAGMSASTPIISETTDSKMSIVPDLPPRKPAKMEILFDGGRTLTTPKAISGDSLNGRP